MADPRQRTEVAELVERHRRDLVDRTDISQAMRRLSQSSGRNPMGPPKVKPRSMSLTLLIGVPAVVAMLVCVATAVLVLAGNLWLQGQLTDPTTTTQKFYAAVKQHNYSEAYSYFTSRYKTTESETDFTSKWSGFNGVNGGVQSFSVAKSVVGTANATITMTVLWNVPNTAKSQTLTLVKVGNDWFIDYITSLHDTSAPTAAP